MLHIDAIESRASNLVSTFASWQQRAHTYSQIYTDEWKQIRRLHYHELESTRYSAHCFTAPPSHPNAAIKTKFHYAIQLVR